MLAIPRVDAGRVGISLNVSSQNPSMLATLHYRRVLNTHCTVLCEPCFENLPRSRRNPSFCSSTVLYTVHCMYTELYRAVLRAYITHCCVHMRCARDASTLQCRAAHLNPAKQKGEGWDVTGGEICPNMCAAYLKRWHQHTEKRR